MHRPFVSVIIPVKNEEAVIRKTIDCVLDSDYPSEKLNVVVVNDGSTDKTGDLLRNIQSDRVKVLNHQRNQGKRRAFATGFNATENEIIICIDSDSFVEPDAIRLLVQPFADNTIVAVCGHGKAANLGKNVLTKLQHWWYQEMFRLLKGMESKYGCVTCCSGILAAYRRENIKLLINEWLDESFAGYPILIGDDRQLTNLVARGTANLRKLDSADDRIMTAIALSTKEAKVVYQSNAIVHTLVPENIRQFIKQQLRWKRAWVHGSLLAGSFMFKKPFPVPLYFYGYQFLTYANPIIIFTWVVYKPLQGEFYGALLFLLGTFFIGFLHGVNVYRYDKTTLECISFRMLFVAVAILLSIFLLPYAWATVWKGGWVTRSETAPPIMD